MALNPDSGDAPRSTVVEFAMVSPELKFRSEASGGDPPHAPLLGFGNTVRYPLAVGMVAVTFRTNAVGPEETASTHSPPRPSGHGAGYGEQLELVRVSMMRVGSTPTKALPPAVLPAPVNQPLTSAITLT